MLRVWLTILLLWGVGCATQVEQEPEPIDPRGASLLGEAQRAYDRGAFAEALVLVDSAAHYESELPAVLYLRGLALTEMYRFDDSMEAFENVLSIDPDYPGTHFSMGNNAFLRGSFSLADTFRDAIRHYRAEETLLRDGLRNGTARAGDRQALAAVLLQIGQSYERLEVSDSARLAYRQALEVDSMHATGYARLAALEQREGRMEEALRQARRAVSLQPRSMDHKVLLGTMLVQEGRFEPAIPYLTEVAQREPWNRTAHYNLGRALLEVGRRDEGTAYLKRSDSLESLRMDTEVARMRVLHHPDDPIRWENYAHLLQQAGRRTEAVRAFNTVRYLEASSDQTQ